MESAGEYVRRYQSSSTAARLSASVIASSMCLMASWLALSSYNSVRARSRSTTASLACVLAFCASSRTRIAPLPFRRNLIVHCTLLAAAEGAFTMRGCLYSPRFREGFFSETGFPAHTILGNSEVLKEPGLCETITPHLLSLTRPLLQIALSPPPSSWKPGFRHTGFSETYFVLCITVRTTRSIGYTGLSSEVGGLHLFTE